MKAAPSPARPTSAGPTGSTSLLEYAGGSTTGAARDANEDAWSAFAAANAFVVVDGAGGGGTTPSAASLTVEAFGRTLSAPGAATSSSANEGASSELPADLRPDPFAAAMLRANAELLAEGARNPEVRGQAAAVCAARFSRGWMAVAHAGDCRVGQFRDGRFGWLTEDHSLVAELRKRGAPPDKLRQTSTAHPNVITRAIGFDGQLPVEVSYHPTRAGDLYLLCTDGLSRHVELATIARLLGEAPQRLDGRCAALLEATEAAGGSDNATVVLVKVR